ncbi:hypothetical protein H696_03086 [Fonticula alba]|uniref:eIF3h C-terminal domain-containing protein n=1 Tax=Fonticula alba TaxID=691883 RepID=A0A058Z8U7_FONAL|nr:hypothetical protein H696_03086 [Fonticula alba]KCV70734.1 hypothetical protein H696_03086 [Fonticula alba]|eukprot:XP_009495250.1 hypothetical protein H696_03086 [Fonticula alba]
MSVAAAAAANASSAVPTIPNDAILGSVTIDALVLMRIIKHCNESPNATGHILGFQTPDPTQANTIVSNLSHCYALPNLGAISNNNSWGFSISPAQIRDDKIAYSSSMLDALVDFNVEANVFGLYRAIQFGEVVSFEVIDDFLALEHPTATMITYDPIRSQHGAAALRAFRISKEFLSLSAAKDIRRIPSEDYAKAGLTFDNIFEEIPLTIRNSALVSAFLFDMPNKTNLSQLSLPDNVYFERVIDALADRINDQTHLTASMRQYGGRYLHNKKAVTEESRLNALLQCTQIESYCKQVSQFAGQALPKLFLAKGDSQ